ncbi:MAG: bifunctional UDP-N-acetylglucosamine diphosphorylase/glucosamine-1-phosphate N-acetyltransferase GlmU [Raoultibacter sp.]
MEASAIVLAAGAGTRMKSRKPKVAHELLGKPIISWVIDAARCAGISSIISVLGHEREQVIPLVEAETHLVFQENRWGTGDAVAVCREAFADKTGSVVVLSGDSPLIAPETIQSLVRCREEAGAAMVVLTMEMDNPTGYGRIVRDARGQVERIVEQKDCTEAQAGITECNSGFYCFDIEELFSALSQVSNDNAQGEYYLTDVLEICREAGRDVIALKTDSPEECAGINSRVQLAEAATCMQRRINKAHMVAGVTMTDPSLVWIGPDVKLSSDVELLPLTFLMGTTVVGEGSIIGPNSRLTDTCVGSACVVDETVAIQAQIDDEVMCGPRTYLRPGAHLCCGSKAGTHVEIKNSTVGKGSKVPHLSYIGDATIGVGVNIGAGTITCNYDGARKHKTIIGDGAFIGSDTMLVAPVSIGDEAIVGAGSTITRDVSARALGLERNKQIEIPDWKDHQRKKHESDDRKS